MRVDLSSPISAATVAPEAHSVSKAPPAPPECAVEPTDDGAAVTPAEFTTRKQVSRDELEKVLARLNTAVQRLEPHLEFSTAEDRGRVVVRLVDGTRNEVLRQYPSDDVIELSKRLDDLRGLLVDRDA